MENACTTAADEPFRPTRRIHGEARAAFTLVELLAVILIVGMLAAILTPVVMQSLTKARNTAIKAEIDMLHMAIMNYKNEYGSFPPCADSTGYAPNGPASKHLSRLFPRCTNPSAQFSGFSDLTPANALKAWLSGFTPDPTNPIVPIANRQKLFDFDTSRLDTNQLIYFPSKKPGSPYIYINKTEYPNSWPATPYSYTVNGQSYSIPANTYSARMVSGTYANLDTFQILCAGRDEQFGTDDDLSNFWPGTFREYQDSLKD